MNRKYFYSLLPILLCFLTPMFMSAQQTKTAQKADPVVKTEKRVVIVQKSVDKDGNVVVEKTIGEGSKADQILKEMAFQQGDENVEIHVITNLENDEVGEDSERLFLFRSTGGEKIEGRLERNSHEDLEIHESLDNDLHIQEFTFFNQEIKREQDRRVIVLEGTTDGWHKDYGGGERKTNCAAMGIYTNHSHNAKGVVINSLIGKGGAERAGLRPGDYITTIASEPTYSYDDLLAVLLKFIPDDRVKVEFTRDGKQKSAMVTLRAWREMPEMASTWRAKVTCDDEDYLGEFNFLDPVEDAEEIKAATEEPKVEVRTINNTLTLEDFKAFPNPSNGIVNVKFTAKEGPITVRVVDITGKEVYNFTTNRFDGTFNREINLTKAGNGTYILSIEQDDLIFSEQLIVLNRA